MNMKYALSSALKIPSMNDKSSDCGMYSTLKTLKSLFVFSGFLFIWYVLSRFYAVYLVLSDEKNRWKHLCGWTAGLSGESIDAGSARS